MVLREPQHPYIHGVRVAGCIVRCIVVKQANVCLTTARHRAILYRVDIWSLQFVDDAYIQLSGGIPMATETPPSRLQVTIREAAEMLGYCEATIYNMIKRGDIKTVGRRKMRRIPMTEILDWQQRN